MERKGFFLTTFSVVFLDMLGIGLVIPLLVPLFLSSTGIMPGSSEIMREITLGALLSSFALAQFVGAPILGALSDRHGRKPILILSITGTLIGYVIFAIGILKGSLWMLFTGRIIDGFTGGNISVILSSIADVSKDNEKARNFGLIGMAFGLGFIIGPYAGGKFADPSVVSWFTFATPFFLAATLALVNLFLVQFIFQETLTVRRKTPVSALTGFRNLRKAFHMKKLRLLFLTLFLLTFGFSFFAQFSQVYYIKTFNFTPVDIGNLFAFIGVWIAITQGVFLRAVTKRFTPEQILRVSIPALAIAFICIIIPQEVWLLYCVVPLVALTQGFTSPNVTAIVSNLADKESQGEILGINQSIQSAAVALPPLIAGAIVSLHHTLPIILASVFTVIGWIVFLLFLRQKDQEVFHEI